MRSGDVKAATEIWRTDPATLRDVALDREAVEARLAVSTGLERVWILCLLERADEAIIEGSRLLSDAEDRFRPLLVLAQAYQRRYSWHEAARLHEEALCMARTRSREAMVRLQTGKRLFDEARYRDAAAEFEWAGDLYRSASQREHLVEQCREACDRAQELQRQVRSGFLL